MFLAPALILGAAPMPAAAGDTFYKLDTPDEIRQSARTLAYDLVTFYKGNQSGQIPGMLPGPPATGTGDYYWWEGGAMMGTYVDYVHLTGDTSYNDVVAQGLLFQSGPDADYQPPNQTIGLGNDDQGFWGMAAMLAAETRFPDPPPAQPQWLALAQAVWNTQAEPARWDEACGGGLRWQRQFFNNGYSYKNAIANSVFFNLGARLARYTTNDTYAQRAAQTWDWLWDVGYIDNENWHVYDGGHVEHNCTDINRLEVSYNPALLIQGSAFLYNYTNGAEKWKYRITTMLDSFLKEFFRDGVIFETDCETRDPPCTTDMLSFKGYCLRWLAVTTQLAPFTREAIVPVLTASARAAVRQCTGPPTGRRCGFYWTTGGSGVFVDPKVDNTTGVGEAMDVLAAVMSLLIDGAEAPVTAADRGTSKGDPNAGQPGAKTKVRQWRSITAADRFGASVVTVLYVMGPALLLAWICVDETKGEGKVKDAEVPEASSSQAS
ncbi:Mannan endo-1,6-alpha-mannosidase [Cordyceps fumosorosea ARSEF 2679]|uniref:Mannan endo-1,6-alpha-mannosidase n=1 Tax=Cordyceps fumosorosea (strain ARSEF 2679) TaxID=1081104 RepID=A0A167PQ30_CORFA|nr:Mannan endo-1,6-alpha-mannosidase [Cordyceps fumosorosea ARSEF 2679]OAA56908.1 Mannan endo-1,6-alpha-mannosidase [Cordyceps fumosorosea ARSEF 2679]